ncbi:MAG TPA: tetratricopeptide repeat protein [Candidatus Acidoferrales bacterium]|nr:tetratricopeptide repeat protein [Candidatus Acidoferrales bacterium]
MKNYRILAVMAAVIAVSFAFIGFQCSSAELTSAKLYIQNSQWDKAEDQLQKDLSTNPQDEEAWYWLGYVRGERQKYTGMMEAFQHALKISDENKQNITDVRTHYWVQLYNQGTKYLQTGRDTSTNYGKAISAFENAIVVEPDSMLSYKGLAYSYLNMALNDSAVEPLMVLWNKDKDQDAAKFLSEVYYEKGQKLKQDFEDSSQDKLNTLKNLNSIVEGVSEEEVAATIGQPDQKISASAQKGKKKSPGTSTQEEKWIYKTYGLTLTFDQDMLKTKKVDFAYNPGIDSTKYLQAIDQFKKALDVLVPATNIYPDDQDLMTVLTNCYIAADMTEQATETFKTGAMKNPGSSDFQYNYGVILLRGNEFEKAVAQFKKAIDAGNATLEQLKDKLAHPDSSANAPKLNQNVERTQSTIWNATYNLGASYVNWGVHIQNSTAKNGDPDSLRKAVSAKFEQSIPYLEKYSTYKSDDPNLWELLAKVYAFMNNTQKAQEAIRKADSLRQVH